MKTLSIFQENPQNNDQLPDFENIFTQQTKQFLCNSKCNFKGVETKKEEK